MEAQWQLQYVTKQTLAQGANQPRLGPGVKKCSNPPSRAREPLTQHLQADDESERNCRRFGGAGKPVDHELEGDRPKSNQCRSDESQQHSGGEANFDESIGFTPNECNHLAKIAQTTFRLSSLHVGNPRLPNEEAQA